MGVTQSLQHSYQGLGLCLEATELLAKPLSTKNLIASFRWLCVSLCLGNYKCLSDFNIKSVSVTIGRVLALLVIILILSFSRDWLLILYMLYRSDYSLIIVVLQSYSQIGPRQIIHSHYSIRVYCLAFTVIVPACRLQYRALVLSWFYLILLDS